MTLTEILTRVAEGKLSVADAEKLIRQGAPRPPVRAQRPVLVGLIFAGVGAILAIIGFGFGYNSWSFTSGARKADGKVIRLVQTTDRRGTTSAPVIRYAVDGQTFEVQSSVSSSPPAYSVGDHVAILYPPEHPHQGRLHSFTELWVAPLVLGGMGTLFFIIGVAVVLCRNRLASQSRPQTNPPR